MQEKVDAMAELGTEVRQVPAVPFTDPKSYTHQVSHYSSAPPKLPQSPHSGSCDMHSTNQFSLVPFSSAQQFIVLQHIVDTGSGGVWVWVWFVKVERLFNKTKDSYKCLVN